MKSLPLFQLVFIFLCLPLTLTGQKKIHINGCVTDEMTKEPISFATVYIKESKVATYTNDSGYYSIILNEKHDSLTARIIGYNSLSEKIGSDNKQIINFKLINNNTQLTEVVVHPGENPAYRILRAIWANKKRNNRKAHNIQCHQYSKIKISLTNIDETFKNKKIFKPYQFVFENIDTSSITGKSYLPVLFMETASNYVYQKDPFFEKDTVLGSQISGIKNESVLDFISGLNQNFDIYENSMTFYKETGFISPISDNGIFFYKYYLLDSADRMGHKCFHISFKPRRKQERTFTGEFWVADSAFAVTELNMRLNPEANVNYLSDFFAEYNFMPINNAWVLTKEHLQTDFNLFESKSFKGLQGEKTTIYSDYIVNQSIQIKDKNNIEQATDSASNPEFWERNRPLILSEKEKNVYKMVDSIKKVPAFKMSYSIMTTIFDAHYNFGKFKVGPYFSLYSYNKVEGHRFRIGGTTTEKFSDKYKFTTYMAYGTKDKELKYCGNLIWMISRNPRIRLNTTYRHDVSQINIAPNEMLYENILSSFIRRNAFTKLQMLNNFSSAFEFDLSPEINTSLGLNYMRVFPGPYIPIETVNGLTVPYLSTTELVFKIHLEKGQTFIQSKFRRKRIRNNHPAFDIKITRSIPHLLKANYSYWKFVVAMQQVVDLTPLGYNKYSIEASNTFGTAPWPFLDTFKGNETYGFDKKAFNMMNDYEFIANRFVSVTTEQHLQGAILNHIPLIRKLNLREVITAKGVIGEFDSRNISEIKLPNGMFSLNKPYIEVGLGIENIFKVIRIDAMWRLSQKKNPNIEVFGLKARLQITL